VIRQHWFDLLEQEELEGRSGAKEIEPRGELANEEKAKSVQIERLGYKVNSRAR